MDREALIEKHRQINVDHGWWGAIFDMFRDVCTTIGIDLDTNEPAFCGFHSQGDGASFTGVYRAYYTTYNGVPRDLHSEEAPAKLREEYPQETELHRIADELCVLSRIYFPVHAYIRRHQTPQTSYVNSNTMTGMVEPMAGDPDDWAGEVYGQVEQTFFRLMRDLADWLYARIEQEYEYLTSDEAVWEAIEANELNTEE